MKKKLILIDTHDIFYVKKILSLGQGIQKIMKKIYIDLYKIRLENKDINVLVSYVLVDYSNLKSPLSNYTSKYYYE